MSNVTIDKIQIEIEASAGKADKAIKVLEENLKTLRSALSGFNTSGIDNVTNSLNKAATAAENLNKNPISPKVNTSGVSGAEKKIGNELDKIKDKFTRLGSLEIAAKGGDSSALTSWQRLATSLQGDIDVLGEKMKRLGDTRVPTQAFTQLETQIQSADDRLKLLQGDYQNVTSGKVSMSDDQFVRLRSEISSARTELDGLVEKQRQMVADGTAYNDPFQKYRDGVLEVQQALNDAKKSMSDMGAKASELPAPPISPYRDANAQLVKISSNSKLAFSNLIKLGKTSFEKVKNGLSGIKQSLSDIGGKLSNNASKGFMKLLKYGLGIRSIYVLFRRLRKAVVESFGELQKSGAFFETTRSNVDALKTSLATLKFQFGAAFEPIFNAVAPALEAFINYLIKAMNVISALFAKLTGKDTYSKVAAVTLATKNNTAGAAKAAKELNKQLQKFDELNNLTSNNSGGGGGGGGGGADKDSATYVEESVENAFKNLPKEIAKIWDVFKQAWDKKGKSVVDAATRAFNNWKKVIKDVGKTIYEVFTDGTGQKWVESILTLFATVLNILGDIGLAFDQAWTDDKNGYKLVKSFFTMFTKINNLLSKIGESWRKAWNDGTGKTIISNILKIITNINNTVGNLAENLGKAWEKNNVGVRIWSNILGLIKDVTTFIKDITAATEEWSQKLDFYPLLESIDKITKSIRKFTKKILDIVKLLYEEYILPIAKKLTESTIPDLLETASGLLDEISKTLDEIDFKTIFKYLKKITELGLDDLMSELKDIVADMEVSLSLIQVELKGIRAFCEWFSKTTLGKLLIDLFKKLEPLRGALSKISGTRINFAQTFQNITAPIKKIKQIVDYIKMLIDIIKGNDWKKSGKLIVDGLKKGLTSKTNFKKAITKVFNYIVEAIKIVFGIHSPAKEMKPYGEDILNGILAGFTDAFKNIDKTIANLKNKIVERIKKYFTNFNPWNTISKSWENAKTFVLTIKAKLDENAEKVFDSFKEKWESLEDKTVKLVTDLKDAAEEKVTNFKETWNGIKEDVKAKLESTITEMGGQTLEDFKNNWNAITSGDSKEVKATLSAETDQSFKDTATEVQSLITKWNEVLGLKDANLKASITGKTTTKISNIKKAFQKLKKLKPAKMKVKLQADNATSKLENIYDKWTYLKSNAGFTLTVGFQDSFTSAFKAAWNGIRDSANAAIDSINKNFKKNIPKVPIMATGGVATGRTQAIIGEAGTEAIVPLERNLGWLKVMSNMILNGVAEQSKYRYSANPSMFGLEPNNTRGVNNNISGVGSDNAVLAEQNRLLAEQNRYLRIIAEKEFSVSSRDVFNATRKEAQNFNNRTGVSPFVF